MSVEPGFEIEEKVDVRLLTNLSSNFTSPQEAIFELIDNGLASRLGDAPISVTITGTGWSTPAGEMTVVTKGGTGMGLRKLHEYFDWGKRSDAEGLNRYGQGGKAAIGYLGKAVRVRTNAFDEDQAYQIKVDDWLSRPGGRPKTHQVESVAAAIPGTAVVDIRISGLRRTINARKLERELAWRYRPALQAGHLVLKVKGKTVRPSPLDGDPRQTFDHLLVLPTEEQPDGAPVRLTGWVGIAPAKFEGRGGIRCSAYGRVIVPNEYFGHKTSSHKASLNSLVGEVDLSFVSPVLNKNAFDTGDPAWLAAKEVVHREMEPFIRKLLQRKEPVEATDEERERAMEAKDLAHQALDRIAAESARRGRGGNLNGRKPPTPTDNPRQRTEPVGSRGPQGAASPPPPDAVGKLDRKGASLDWDVRPLDPRTRSATESQDGRTEIIVNKQYPLYIERDGDLAYMLETGLLEELKLGEDGDDKPVTEYHDQVTDALYEALKISGKSRR